MAKTRKRTPNIRQVPPLRAATGRRKAFSLLIAIAILGLVGWVFLGQASKAAELERHIREMRRQKAELQRQNDHLTYLIAQRASVEQLQQRAVQLGYVPVRQARFLAVTDYPSSDDTSLDVAALPETAPGEGTAPSATVGWWRTVADQFEAWSHTERP
jgi:hypothetical protein